MIRAGGFEANAQTLRILARLEKKETEDNSTYPVINGNDNRLGLNLTYRALASILKYDNEIPRLAEFVKESERKKPIKGYYHCEFELVRKIKQDVMGSDIKDFKTIECAIMDVADDIAYSTYDLEDALKAGFISTLIMLSYEADFKQKIIDKVNEELRKKYGTKSNGRHLSPMKDFDKHIVTTFEEMFEISEELRNKYSANTVIDDNIMTDISVVASTQLAAASSELCENGYVRGAFASKLVTEFMNAVEVELNHEKPQISKVSMQIDKFVKMQILKTICYDAIIGSPRMKMAERPGIAIIKRIFNTLADEKEGCSTTAERLE